MGLVNQEGPEPFSRQKHPSVPKQATVLATGPAVRPGSGRLAGAGKRPRDTEPGPKREHREHTLRDTE